MEKNLMHTPQLSWNWHKGWNLPQISIQIPDSLKTYLSRYGRLKCEIKSIAYSMGKLRNRIPIEVGVTGTTKKILWMGKLTYLGSRFASTSQSNKGTKLHLVILIYGVSETTRNFNTTILASFISPPIFVDARNYTRHSRDKKDQKIYSDT